MKKIISYNVNGIRAALSKNFSEWLISENPDILCIQESKAQPEQIPVLEFELAGYQSYWFSAQKKGYSGVGILTKSKPDNIVYGMGIPIYDSEGRVIRADYGDVSIISVYHPSGTMGDERQSFKYRWLDDFLLWVEQLKKTRPKLIIAGDFNICHENIDIHDPVRNAVNSGFLPEERAWLSKFINSGFIDTFRWFNKQPHNYTWWSYRANARVKNLGWRIDYQMASLSLERQLKNASILSEAVHSDHCPTSLEIDF